MKKTEKYWKTIDVEKKQTPREKMKHIITHMATEHDNNHAGIPLWYPQAPDSKKTKHTR